MCWFEKMALRRFYEADFCVHSLELAFLAKIDLLKDNYGVLLGGIDGVNNA